jgi:hypothetical protein
MSHHETPQKRERLQKLQNLHSPLTPLISTPPIYLPLWQKAPKRRLSLRQRGRIRRQRRRASGEGGRALVRGEDRRRRRWGAAYGRGRGGRELGFESKRPPTEMTSRTHASVERRMNRRWKNRSVGRIIGATELRGETTHRMVWRPIFITRRSSCARVWEERKISSTPDEPMV